MIPLEQAKHTFPFWGLEDSFPFWGLENPKMKQINYRLFLVSTNMWQFGPFYWFMRNAGTQSLFLVPSLKMDYFAKVGIYWTYWQLAADKSPSELGDWSATEQKSVKERALTGKHFTSWPASLYLSICQELSVREDPWTND